MCPVFCISGIDTDIGKTVATGLMARTLLSQGYSTITQKVVQTGCSGIADDIIYHRKLMGIELLPEDLNGLTCPYVFKKPCSPHLAAELEQETINPEEITRATKSLSARYDYVLLEGAGGLLVPLTREMTFIDYLQQQGYPLILVSSPRLGSINHTLSALELAQGRGIEVKGIVYNCHVGCDDEIRRDSRKLFAGYLQKYGFSPVVVDLESEDTYFEQGKQFDCMHLFE
ncbi:MAG: dethiobiotin synthase [Thermodesulfobacteriota bacterium]|nr:dethiobiotin synthase [Thermodesulfobacteriota bacterium]